MFEYIMTIYLYLITYPLITDTTIYTLEQNVIFDQKRLRSRQYILRIQKSFKYIH